MDLKTTKTTKKKAKKKTKISSENGQANLLQQPSSVSVSDIGSTSRRPSNTNFTDFTNVSRRESTDFGGVSQPYGLLENNFLSGSLEQSELTGSNGLTRLQQLSVDKKLKYLEPPMYFYNHPEPEPLKVGFEYTGTDFTHLQVLRAVKAPLEYIPEAKVTSLKFMARNVILGTMWVDNRWVIELSTKQCVTVLLGRGICINGEQIKIRKYDEFVKEDYTKFLLNKENFVKKGSKKHKSLPSQKVDATHLLKSGFSASGDDADVNTMMSLSNDGQETF